MACPATPFFWQQTDYTCGPASLQMGLAALGIRRSQRALARLSHTTAADGTSRRALVDAARHSGVYAAVQNGATVWDLRRFLRRSLPVIVNYIEPDGDTGHYAVVTKVTWTRVVMNDPWNGRSFSMSIPQFLARWYDGARRNPRWVMVLASSDELVADLHHLHPVA